MKCKKQNGFILPPGLICVFSANACISLSNLITNSALFSSVRCISKLLAASITLDSATGLDC